MTFRLTPIAPVLLGVISTQVALGIMTPLIPLLLLHTEASAFAIGLVASAYFIGFLAGALSADRIVISVGHIRGFAVFAAIAADAGLLLTFADAAWEVAALRILIGYACSGLFLVAESWLNDRADAATRGRTFGAYMVASWGGSVIGPLALNVVPANPAMFVLVGLCFATALLPMALTHQPNPTIGRRARMGWRHLYRVSPVGVVCCLGSGLVNSALYAMAPVFLERRGHDAAGISAFISVAMLAGLAVQFPIGMLSDRVGRRPVAVAALAAAFAFATLLGLAGAASLPVLMALGFCLAGMTAPLYGLGAGQTNDRMERGDYVAASGGLLFVWSLGSSVGPSLAGAAMGRLGPSGLFAYLAVVLGAVGLFTGLRMLQRAPVPRERHSVFVPSPSAPPRHAELGAIRALKPLHAVQSIRGFLRWPFAR